MTEAKAERHAQLDLGFVRRADRTIMDRRIFSWPFVVTRTFWLDQQPADMLTVILQTGSGALHDKDDLVQRLRLGKGASVHLTTQGATSVHRAAPGSCASEAVEIAIEAGGFLEYLPEPRILFPDAALTQTIDIDCAPEATAIISDAFTVHDPGGGDRSFRKLESTTRLRLGGGEPVLVDRLDIGGMGQGRRQGQYRAYGSLMLVAGDPPEVLEELSLKLTAYLGTIPNLYAAASPLPGHAGVGVKLAGRDLRSLRAGLEATWIEFRLHSTNHPPASRRKSDQP